jgi:hypothetical protein
VFQVFDSKFEFMDAMGKNSDYFIVAIQEKVMKIFKVPKGNLEEMVTSICNFIFNFKL